MNTERQRLYPCSSVASVLTPLGTRSLPRKMVGMTPVILVIAIGVITCIWLRREREREAVAVGLIYLVVIAVVAYVLWGLDWNVFNVKLAW